MHGLTHSYVISKSHLLPVLLNNEKLIYEQNSPYFLLIYSIAPQFTKISVYPVYELPIVKYIIGGSKLTDNTIDKMLSLLNTIHPIILHTSGIVYKDANYVYEIYFTGIHDKNLTDFQQKITQLPGIEFIEDVNIFIKK